jgi:hypothetical protein
MLSNHPSVLGMLHNQKRNDENFYKKKQIERLVELNNRTTVDSVETMIKRIEHAEISNKLTVERAIECQVDDIKKRIENRRVASRAASANEDNEHTKEEIHL